MRPSPPTLLPVLLLLGAGLGPAARAQDPAPLPADTTHARADTLAAADTLALPATNRFEIVTPLGRMVVRLYDETPLHRDNFKRLAVQQFYDSTTFHRVIEGFMIQGGDANSKDDDPANDGMGDPGYTIPAEFVPARFHKRGALAAARTADFINPERRSSGSQFYIVQGQVVGAFELGLIEEQVRSALRDTAFAFTPEAREAYQAQGGTPMLDMQYTVFGELVEGFDVLDAIAAVATPRKSGEMAAPAVIDRPYEDVWMVVRPLPEEEEEAPPAPPDGP